MWNYTWNGHRQHHQVQMWFACITLWSNQGVLGERGKLLEAWLSTRNIKNFLFEKKEKKGPLRLSRRLLWDLMDLDWGWQMKSSIWDYLTKHRFFASLCSPSSFRYQCGSARRFLDDFTQLHYLDRWTRSGNIWSKSKVDGMQLEPNMDENWHTGLLCLGAMPLPSRCKLSFAKTMSYLLTIFVLAAWREPDSARLGWISNRLQLQCQLPLPIGRPLLWVRWASGWFFNPIKVGQSDGGVQCDLSLRRQLGRSKRVATVPPL